jgi:hypothetical protein
MYSFLTSCVSVPNGDDINEMANIAVDIEPEDFLKLAEDLDFKETMLEELGYNKWASGNETTPEELFINDFGISLCESRFQGIPALYVRHSGIENIYIPNTEFNKYLPTEEESEERYDVIDKLSEDYENIFHYGLKNENFVEDINNFIKDNKETLNKYNIPLTSLSAEFSNFDTDFLSALRIKEQDYMSELITVKDTTVMDFLLNKSNQKIIKNNSKLKL